MSLNFHSDQCVNRLMVLHRAVKVNGIYTPRESPATQSVVCGKVSKMMGTQHNTSLGLYYCGIAVKMYLDH